MTNMNFSEFGVMCRTENENFLQQINQFEDLCTAIFLSLYMYFMSLKINELKNNVTEIISYVEILLIDWNSQENPSQFIMPCYRML